MKLFLPLLFFLQTSALLSQNYPWERPLKMAWSADGITFNTPTIFQDSSGVPSVIRWKGDTLVCAFQWFRVPVSSPTWDRVAVKFSYDNGSTWTQPVPIVINGLPPTYQRPFDPTLTVFGTDSIRIYYSSSDGMPPMGLDSTVNTYSAKSIDGIHYTFEPNARVDVVSNRVIDPAVIYFNNSWHYASPVGSPQQGAYHYLSPNGLSFASVPVIPSDNQHNWTGNYMVNGTNDLRFYGSGPFIWYNSSPNGGTWNGYVNTNVQGGDPSVVKIASGNYLMIFVGNPYTTGIAGSGNMEDHFTVFPNPVTSSLSVDPELYGNGFGFSIFTVTGELVRNGYCRTSVIDMADLLPGIYFLEAGSGNSTDKGSLWKFIKE